MFLDAWMRFAGRRYHVGLATAASLHGGEPDSATWWVVVDQIPDAIPDGRLRFFERADAGRDSALRDCASGAVVVSGPERTAFELVEYATDLGGIEVVEVLLRDLPDLDGALLATVAGAFQRPTLQRVGALLEKLGRKGSITALKRLVPRDAAPVSLLPGPPVPTRGRLDRWRVRHP